MMKGEQLLGEVIERAKELDGRLSDLLHSETPEAAELLAAGVALERVRILYPVDFAEYIEGARSLLRAEGFTYPVELSLRDLYPGSWEQWVPYGSPVKSQLAAAYESFSFADFTSFEYCLLALAINASLIARHSNAAEPWFSQPSQFAAGGFDPNQARTWAWEILDAKLKQALEVVSRLEDLA